jgi:MFS family permease
VYVDCVREGQKMTVAAALTAGDADQLMVGRNGVFYDRQGRDWNATIVKMVDHPISLRQAFWSPYKRLGRMVSEQLQKLAASKAKAADDQMAALATTATSKATAPVKPAAAAPTAFDVGKFAGIFAAIGLAVGALGTALASVLGGLLTLKWWQIPLALVGLLLLVSGPAVIVAWFKLRSRNLGPLLDANGWAVNARARINIPFGTSLTQLAVLPPNAQRTLDDPYAEKPTPWVLYGVIAVALLALAWKLGWLG